MGENPKYKGNPGMKLYKTQKPFILKNGFAYSTKKTRYGMDIQFNSKSKCLLYPELIQSVVYELKEWTQLCILAYAIAEAWIF
jgi:hypothetical protein